MKVFVLLGITYYEGDDILGIFSSRKKAEAVIKAVRSNRRYSYDDIEIREVKLNTFVG